MTNEERVFLTEEQAIAMLDDDDGWIHTFRSAGMTLLGADIKRSEIIKKIKKYQPELSGEMATNMHHGMVLIDEHGPLFIRTKEDDSNV